MRRFQLLALRVPALGLAEGKAKLKSVSVDLTAQAQLKPNDTKIAVVGKNGIVKPISSCGADGRELSASRREDGCFDPLPIGLTRSGVDCHGAIVAHARLNESIALDKSSSSGT